MPAESAGKPSAAVSMHAADALVAAIQRKGNAACVGIDPVLERLPSSLRRDGSRGRREDVTDAFRSFISRLLDAVERFVPAVKFQSACFERYGSDGARCLEQMIAAARQRDLEVILDVKRGDIGISTAHYAASAFGDPAMDPSDRRAHHAQWVTANPYLGTDGLLPFLEAGGGAFALVRTSNLSADAVQSQKMSGGGTLAEMVASMVAETGGGFLGDSGYSALGAVVGATKRGEVERLRALMPRQVLLVPGFGAQGGTAEDIRPCFDGRGLGAVIAASRSVIYAFDADAEDWSRSIAEAAARFAEEVGRAAGMRG